ncbi:MAG TPA: amino acid adenylation domain-containing protein [Pyrinomonadaceae bacterium]
MSTEVAGLSIHEKRALLAQLLKQKAERPEAPSPLSFGQQAWWFLYQLEPQNAAYNIILPARICSEIDTEALRRAYQGLVERHASLRTTYALHEGAPVQIVQTNPRTEFVVVDASLWDEEDLNRTVADEAHRPFDLENGPVIRGRLFTRSETEHILVMVVHHIAFDLWSLMQFMHELTVSYDAEKNGRTPSLEPVKYRYTDYVRWQRALLAGPEGERLWGYWQKKLAGELPVLSLPAYRPRPPIQTYRGAAQRFTIDAELSGKLKKLSQENGATLYMTLLAAYQVLLSRYSGQEDILVGSLVASGRNRAEYAKLVGFLDNQIVLRANLAENSTFKEFLAQVRQTVLDAFEHQQFPFTQLVERLQPARDASRSPIYQTMFILQRAQLPEEVGLLGFGLGLMKARVELSGLTLESLDFDRRVAGGLAGQLDQTLIVADINGILEGSLQYNPDVFDADSIARMAEHFQTILRAVVADQHERVATLPLLGTTERQRQLAEWNATATGQTAFECLHQSFEAQVERTPEAAAAIFQGRVLSYRELNQRANQLAHYLRSLGVGPEVRVGVCLERSLEMAVAVLGVLKSGGAYVPLDPAYPKDRLAFMLDDIQTPVLLTQEKLVATLPQHAARTVCLDTDWDTIARFDETNPAAVTTQANLAYIIYTSGSTGRPKGVMIDHRGAANTIVDINRRYSVGEGDRVLALSSLSFDLSVYDMFGTLAVGAGIVIPNPSATPDPAHWLELIDRERVTIWNSAPALMEIFAEHVSGNGQLLPRSLRLVMMSGDWIPVKLPDHIRSLGENIEVYSLGGATEASIWSITFPIGEVDPVWKSIPYGRPMLNQKFHVLDSFQQPTPVGVVGELYIGGIGVALGYHNRQELTAQKFIPDPFAVEPGARLYRTGDLGRYLPSGDIEFLGRIDGQVKVRGFRIELGEIETMLDQHPSVKENVVTTQTGASGEKRLVAYVVPKQETGVETIENKDDALHSTAVWESLLPAGQRQAAQSLVKIDTQTFPALIECLERLTVFYLCRAFTNLGVFTEPGASYEYEQLLQRCGIVPRYRKAVRRWLELLADNGLLRQSGEAFESPQPLPNEPPAPLWEKIKAESSWAEMGESFEYFKSCGENLAQVLTGDIHPTQLLFREGGAQVAERFYEEGFRYCNAIAREVIGGLVRAWPEKRKLRALEIGAGVGSTTAWLLPELPPERTSYVYTDVSKYFLEVGRKNFAQHTFLEYSLLDIERDPHEQGYEPHSFDLIVASSVLHATRDVRETLKNVRSLLAPSGLLVLLEETSFHDWFNVVGIQEGFDRFEDEDLRRRHPFLSAEQWEAELRAHGFDNVTAFNQERFNSEFLGLDLIVGQASASAVTHLTKDALRSFLREKLPEFMIPSSFMMLDALPLTPNGKVDRGALPSLDSTQAEAALAFVAPRSPTEETLAKLWSQVLGVEKAGVLDNFFEVGGDSLLATQLITRLRQAFEVELPLHCLFESPTIAGLAEKVEAARGTEQAASSAPVLRRIPRDGALPLSFAQHRLWFLDQLVPGNPFYNVMAAVRFTGSLDRAVLERSINEIVRRHESLRTTFTEFQGQPAQVIGEPWAVKMKLVDLGVFPETEQGERLQQLATEENQRSFDLAQGPLLRVTLVRLSATEHVLLLAIHHIVFDGWSFGVFLREIATHYEAFLGGNSSPLPELTYQYADFAHWQREWLQGEVLATQLGYWKKQLAGSTALQLPTDRPRPATQTFNGARQSFVIPATLRDAIKSLSNEEEATFFMTLLAALQTLLYRHTGVEDIVVGSPIANRQRAELDDLIGFFLNALPLRADLSGNPSFRELLGRVRETALGAYAHQDVPFEKLVEELRPERTHTHTPLFHIWFTLQNAPVPPLRLPDLQWSMLQVDDGTSKFDLVLSMFETNEGIVATWIYNTDLFDASTISRFAGQYETLLTSIVAQPDARLNALEIRTEAEREEQRVKADRRQESNIRSLKNVRRRGVNLSEVSLTKTEYLAEGETLPLVVRPATDYTDLIDWARTHREYIESELPKHGAILFRDFSVNDAATFEQFAQTICPELFSEYGDLPREKKGGKVYGSTPYPQDRMILFHNESSHLHQWPMKIMFYCVTAAEQGGETPIVDGRKIYQLLDPEIRRRFEEKRLMYVRNYSEGLDVSWQSFFQTGERAEVEAYCRKAGMEFEWTNETDLRTRKIAQATARHPRTGEMVFFNQILAHHFSCLEPEVRQSMLTLFTEETLPRNVYYGDGTPIEDDVMEEIHRVYREATVSFPWHEGDILLLDNMLTAHGRNPFTGARKIMVALGDMISHDGF